MSQVAPKKRNGQEFFIEPENTGQSGLKNLLNRPRSQPARKLRVFLTTVARRHIKKIIAPTRHCVISGL
jgi:hypothetical protein